MPDVVRMLVHASMVIVDGGPEAALPAGTGGPVLAGPEAVFVAGRVEHDAPTLLRVGPAQERGALLLAHEGDLATPLGLVRIVNVEQDVFAEVRVPGARTPIRIFLSDLEEPDEILVAVNTAGIT